MDDLKSKEPQFKVSDVRFEEAEAKYFQSLRRDVSTFFKGDKGSKVSCPICCADKTQEYAIIDDFEVDLCQCGFLFVNPRPPKEKLSEFYSRGESNQLWHLLTEKTAAKRKEMFRHNRIPVLRRIVESLGHVKEGVIKLADIGCGTGPWMEVVREEFPDIELLGIDPGAEAEKACIAKGLNIRKDNLECCYEVLEGQFDIVTCFSLLEHTVDPSGFVRLCNKLLRQGGKVFFTVPNVWGFDFASLPVKHRDWAIPQHVNFFSPPTLKALFCNNGFSVEEVTSFGLLDVNLVQRKVTQGVKIGNEFLERLLEDSVNEATRKAFQRFLMEHNLSGQMYIIAGK
jgi:2-polyprenyl-3-methyl-5-hydroxy-6-metoxy-1,4-benzoquinol methylase